MDKLKQFKERILTALFLLFTPKYKNNKNYSEKRNNFLRDVFHEVVMLRKHATKDEIANLNLSTFRAESKWDCIYGQLAGVCSNNRAKQLMDKACVRVMDLFGNFDVKDIKNLPIDSEHFTINGEYAGQTWHGDCARSYRYLSAIEGYILTKDANIAGIMAFIKRETNILKL